MTQASTTQSVGLQRNTIDQFYTKPELASKCIATFKEVVKPTSQDMVIEPSAGSGSFSDLLKDNVNLLCFDIEPKKEYITKADFLNVDESIFEDINVHCIGNPPFGRQSALAKRFIKKCASFASSISFILPKSFKKPSFYKSFPLTFHKVYEEDCPKNSFMVNEHEYDVPCVFQIWIRMETPRVDEEVAQPRGFTFVGKDSSPNLSLRRVGFYAGKAFTDTASKSSQSHYFVKLNNDIVVSVEITLLVERLNNIQYEFNNTVGARSIAKSEFTKVLNVEIETYLQN